ncbi:hypothetical protein ACFQ38_01180, partial [Sporosarcina contaminans]
KFGSEQLETFKKFWDENGKAIMDLVKKYFNLVLSDIKMVMGLIQGVFQTVWPIISGVVKTVWAVIKSIVSTSINTVLGVIQTVLKLLQGDWSGAWETIKTTASTIMDNIIKYFKDIDLLQVGKDIIQGLIDGIGSMANAVVEKVKTLADSIPNWIKKVLGIHSPSRVTKKLGEETGTGLAIGITNTQKQVTKATDGVAKAVDTGFTKTMQRITKQAEQAASGTKKSTDRIKKSFKEAFDAVKHEYESGNFTATQYVKALESVGSRYAKTADAQRKISAEMLKMEKEAAKEREEIDKKTFEKTKSFIEARRQANEISLTQELAAWERVHDRYKQGSDERIEAEKNIQRVRQEIYDQLLQANDEFLKKTQEINKNVEDEEKRLNEVYEKAVEERTRSIRDFAGLFDEVVFKAEKTGDDLINNLKGQVSYIDQWSYSIEQLAKRGIDDGLLEELRAMGPKAMPELMALNSLTDSKLKEYESLWKKKTEQARSIALKEMSGLKTDTEKQISELHKNAEKQLEAVRKEFDSKVKSIRFGAEDEFSAMKSTLPDIGKEAIRGLQSGLENMRGPLMKTARGIADEVASTIRKALQVKSPSRVTTEIGEFVGEGLMVGMENMLSDIKRVASRMGEFAVPTMPDVAMGAVSGGGFTSNRNVSQSQESNQTFLIQPTPIYLDGQIIGEAVFDVVDVKMDSKRTSQLRYGGWKK